MTISQQGDNLVVNGGDVQSLEVFSLTGISFAKNEGQSEINLAGTPSGVYIVNINRSAMKKFVWR